MTFDKITDLYGKITRRQAILRLSHLSDNVFKPNNWKFANQYDSETETSISGNSYYVTVGDKALYDNCTNSECNKAAYVLMIKDMYHEKQHVWQRTKAWNDNQQLNSVKNYRKITDIVRREFVREYFPSAYYNNYSNDPSEMDAEKTGIRQALSYFESDPLVSKSEAEEILFQLMMSDDCVHKEIMDEHRDKLTSIYDVLTVFEEHADEAAEIKYPVTDILAQRFRNETGIDFTITREFLYSKDYEEYRKSFNACTTGIEQDKVLEQVILVMQPNIVRKAPLRLRQELIDCRRQMELSSFRNGPHTVPPKKINYAIENLELTSEDLASIPMGDGLKL